MLIKALGTLAGGTLLWKGAYPIMFPDYLPVSFSEDVVFATLTYGLFALLVILGGALGCIIGSAISVGLGELFPQVCEETIFHIRNLRAEVTHHSNMTMMPVGKVFVPITHRYNTTTHHYEYQDLYGAWRQAQVGNRYVTIIPEGRYENKLIIQTWKFRDPWTRLLADVKPDQYTFHIAEKTELQ